MNIWPFYFSYFMAGIMLLLAVMGMLLAVFMPGIERWNRRFFIFLFVILTLLVIITIIDLIICEIPGMILVKKIIWCVESVVDPFPIVFFSVFLLHSCKEEWRRSSLFRINITLWITFSALIVSNMFIPLFFYATPEGMFSPGTWYSLLLIPVDIMVIVNLEGVFRRRSRMSGRFFCALLFYILPLSVALFIYTFFYIPMLFYIGLVISAFSMFGIILMDQIDQYLRQRREIATQRASIMVLQMRPHFIFNTMMALYSLCSINPKKTQEVMLDFTTYLRKNFSAIASGHTIPFSEELEHARAYLAVEEAMYEDSLVVEYDTPYTNFRVPPLTLQPIVENAVKHGMDPDSAQPLHITVMTRKADSGWEITVEDNGSGFMTPTDSDPHIALENIQQRLKMMCRGNLTITPRTGGGTMIRVMIPE